MNQAALKDLKNYRVKSYTYLYRKKYGSPVVENKNIIVKSATVLDDGKGVELELSELIENRVFDFSLNNIKSANGDPLGQTAIYYTLNKRIN